METNEDTISKQPLRLMLLDSPRTTCQLFYKVWQCHPQIAWGRSYHGFNGYQLYSKDRLPLKLRHKNSSVDEVYYEKWVKPYEDDPEVRKLYPPVLSDAQKKFRDDIEGSERDGLLFFGKEHTLDLLNQDTILSVLRRQHSSHPTPLHNPTYIPSELLKTLTPIFLIRHPQLIIDSSWRGLSLVTPGMMPEDEDFEFKTTLRWTKLLYDYFKDELGIEGIVVDSEDFIYRTDEVMGRLCEVYGLERDGVKTAWEPVPEEYWPKSEVARVFVGHLLSSKGVEREETPSSTNLDDQTAKWEEKDGAEIAGALRKRVEAEMDVYEYLRARKLQT